MVVACTWSRDGRRRCRGGWGCRCVVVVVVVVVGIVEEGVTTLVELDGEPIVELDGHDRRRRVRNHIGGGRDETDAGTGDDQQGCEER